MQHGVKGICYLHDQNLCHLYLKLNNVLFTEDDVALLCDIEISLSRNEGCVDR